VGFGNCVRCYVVFVLGVCEVLCGFWGLCEVLCGNCFRYVCGAVWVLEIV